MRCFEVVQRVLDVTYAQIPGDEPARDAAIARALRDMSGKYLGSLARTGGPDFSDPVTRFAYVFGYVPAHSHWVHELLSWSPEAVALFAQPRVRVTCLGGGPGSDLVGVLKFMAAEGRVPPALFCEIVDGCIQWKETWSDLAFTLEWASPLHTDYVIHNVADPSTWAAPCNFGKADVFTVSFFASEIFHLGASATQYLTHVFSTAKPGALILINDNDASCFYEWFDGIAAATGLETLLAQQGERKIYDRDEQMSAVGHFREKFDWRPKLTGRVAWRVFRKR